MMLRKFFFILAIGFLLVLITGCTSTDSPYHDGDNSAQGDGKNGGQGGSDSGGQPGGDGGGQGGSKGVAPVSYPFSG